MIDLYPVTAFMYLAGVKVGSDGAPVAVPVGRGAAATALDQGAEIGADRLGATAQSPSVWLAS